MLFGELRKIFSRTQVIIAVILFVPIVAISTLAVGQIAGVTHAPYPAEIAAATARLDDLMERANSETPDIRGELLAEYTTFRASVTAFNQTVAGSNAYANGAAFNATQMVFENFYDRFQHHMGSEKPRVFVTSRDYRILHDRMDELYMHLGAHAQPTAVQLQQMPATLIAILHEAVFEDRFGAFIPTSLQPNQRTSINRTVGYINSGLGSVADRHDFTVIASDVLAYQMFRYYAANRGGSVRQYQGFDHIAGGAARAVFLRNRYLVESGANTFDYSQPLRFWNVMHARTGTGFADFVFNNLELVKFVLILFVVLLVVHCVWNDINRKTIAGTLVTHRNRAFVIMMKMVAIWATVAGVLAAFVGVYAIIGFWMGVYALPPVLFVSSLGMVYTASTTAYLGVYLAGLFLKLIFFATLGTYVCLAAKSTRAVWSILLKLAIVFFAFTWAMLFISNLITVPLMVVIWGLLVWGILHQFKGRDF